MTGGCDAYLFRSMVVCSMRCVECVIVVGCVVRACVSAFFFVCMTECVCVRVCDCASTPALGTCDELLFVSGVLVVGLCGVISCRCARRGCTGLLFMCVCVLWCVPRVLHDVCFCVHVLPRPM